MDHDALDAAPPSPYAEPAPATPLEPGSARLLAWLERIAGDLQVADGSGEAAEAREAFLRSTGRVHDGDRIFDERMALYLEWFLLDRVRARPPRVTPIEAWFASHGAALSPDDRAWVVGLAASHRSVFRLASAPRGGPIRLNDLLHGIGWTVAGEPPPGLGVGDVFHARLAGVQGRVHFTGTFCYHPPEAAQRLTRYLAAAAPGRSASEEVLGHLLQLRLRYDREVDTPVETIYALDPRSRR